MSGRGFSGRLGHGVSFGGTAGSGHSDAAPGGSDGKGHRRVDPFDVHLEDDELLDEVELTANLIVAANQSDTPMSLAEIDRILGVEPRRVQG